MNLDSSTDGSEFKLYVPGNENVNWLDVRDGGFATGSADIYAFNSLNTANNDVADPSKWIFNSVLLFNDASNGNWNIGTTWGGSCTEGCEAGDDYPGTGDVTTVDSNIVTLNADIASGNLTIAGGDLNAASYTLSVDGSFVRTSGTFTYSTSGISFTATDTDNTIDMNGFTFYDMRFNGAGGIWTATSDLDFEGSLSIAAGTFDLNDYELYAQTWEVLADGTFIPGVGTVIFDAEDGDNFIRSGSTTFYDVRFESAGAGLYSLQDAMTASGTLRVSTGLFDLSGNDLTVVGDFTVAATLRLDGTETLKEPTKAAGSTVEYAGSAVNTDIKDWDYKNLTVKSLDEDW